ncbi:hypothetical protein DGG96_09505 [Legionella qingyii]|uniref:Uncharacterized protein n=1 Tax=Legionella qingyii TaxID=2184757 RepID=A0A317U6D0_9GAMM|nr:hypothetical protein [Legionella qingyii]PWY55960.1 hypothetical protein DGG96_09505 [Legionella qingyii]
MDEIEVIFGNKKEQNRLAVRVDLLPLVMHCIIVLVSDKEKVKVKIPEDDLTDGDINLKMSQQNLKDGTLKVMVTVLQTKTVLVLTVLGSICAI